MTDRSGIIEYKGKEIVLVDYSDLDSVDALKERIEKVTRIEKGKKNILELIDVTGSYTDPEMFKILKESALGTVNAKKVAIVGVAGVKKILLAVVNRFSGLSIEPKNTIEEAKEWLARD